MENPRPVQASGKVFRLAGYLCSGKEFSCYLLCNERGISPGTVVDDNIYPHLFPYSFPYELGRILYHSRALHPFYQRIEGMGPDKPEPQRGSLSSPLSDKTEHDTIQDV